MYWFHKIFNKYIKAKVGNAEENSDINIITPKLQRNGNNQCT